MTMRNLLAGLLACGLLVSGVNAAAIFKITEAFAGISGDDGTADWFEVTNFGDMAGDTGTLLYDDSSPNIGDAVALQSLILQPHQSAVFIIDSSQVDDGGFASVVDQFISVWGDVPRLGMTVGNGGGMSQNGETIYIGVEDNGSFVEVDSLTYPSVGSDVLATFEDPTGMGPVALSQFGINNAYRSAEFGDDMRSLIGSPGVPEPSTIILASLAGVALLATRRTFR